MSTYVETEHPRERTGQWAPKPQSRPEVKLATSEAGEPNGYQPGSGVAPDGFVFPELRDHLAPADVVVRVYKKTFEPSFLNATGETWHIATEDANGARYGDAGTGRPPSDLGEYTHLPYAEVFRGDVEMTLEEAPKWVRDFSLMSVREPSTQETEMRLALTSHPQAGRDAVRAAND